uniref:Uncharacterized protein n=1 Tax=Oryza barthii TaxID=65489 RepID=A0A0D3HSU3_9ORYZ
MAGKQGGRPSMATEIVKLQPLYASRRGVLGASLQPWVWVLLGFTTNCLTSWPVDRTDIHIEGVKF